ncbi:MAG: stage III sporulation protein AB [Lachnospiraceae bacterium]
MQKHMEELQNLKHIILMIRGEIKYTKAPLGEIFGHLSMKCQEPYKKWLHSLKLQLDKRSASSFVSVWNTSIDQNLSLSFLNKKDIGELKMLGNLMGCLDQEMQLATLDLYMEQLDRQLQKVREEIPSKKRLSNYLGVMGGIFIAIILM